MAGSGSNPNPAKDPFSDSPCRSEESATPSLPQILIVEDNKADVFLIKEAIALAHIRADLHVITDGEEAVRWLDRTDAEAALACPSLVILDINLPKRDGGEVLQRLRQSPKCGNTVVEILRYTAVDDCGRVINHVLLDGQLHGGIAQGIGQAMGEHAIYDPASGQLLTATFMDYEMPRADGMPEIRLHDRSIPSPGNPLGVKGAGEAGTTGAVPTVANAVIDALRPLGIHHLDFPYTPDRVWHAIEAARGRREV